MTSKYLNTSHNIPGKFKVVYEILVRSSGEEGTAVTGIPASTPAQASSTSGMPLSQLFRGKPEGQAAVAVEPKVKGQI